MFSIIYQVTAFLKKTTYRKFGITIRLMTNEFLRPLLHDVRSIGWANSHLEIFSKRKKKVDQMFTLLLEGKAQHTTSTVKH